MNPAIKFASGPLGAVVTYLLCHLGGLGNAAALTAAITVWTALWWLLEPIALGFTSLVRSCSFRFAGSSRTTGSPMPSATR